VFNGLSLTKVEDILAFPSTIQKYHVQCRYFLRFTFSANYLVKCFHILADANHSHVISYSCKI